MPPTVRVAEQPGAEISEDVVRVLPHAVVLLDGATQLRPRARSGGWYASTLADELAGRLSSTDDLADVLAAAIAAVTAEHGLIPGTAPSSTVALARWTDEIVEALVLADSPVVFLTATEAHPVTDERLARLSGNGIGGYRQRLREGGGFGEQHLDALRTSTDITGARRNVPGGFWVAEAVPAAAHHATRATRPRAEVDALLLASDGVSRGVDEYDTYGSWTELGDDARRNGPRAVLERVRRTECLDRDGVRFPRAKRHDDQALVLVEFNNC